jgi:GTP cyclohydrolase I
LDEILNPQGVAVVIEGVHMCSMMRGVKEELATMATTALLGSFKNDAKTRNEFMISVK